MDEPAAQRPEGLAVAIGPLTVRADASDACGLTNVTFALGFQEVVDTEPPFRGARFEPPFPSAALQLTVTAWDVAGNATVATSQVVHLSHRVDVGAADTFTERLVHRTCVRRARP
jgi:hypothetical protein